MTFHSMQHVKLLCNFRVCKVQALVHEVRSFTCFSSWPQCSRHCIMLRVSIRLIMTCPTSHTTH